jgi:hypothetical protein
MAIFRRLFSSARTSVPEVAHTVASSAPVQMPVLYGGSHDLEVVGESHYQDALWRAVGGRTIDRVRHSIHAVLVTETDNPYDADAISVWIMTTKVGYLAREDAAEYRPGLLALERQENNRIALAGVIVGGGMRSDGPGLLGVWLSHDPRDFGLAPLVSPEPLVQQALRTGLSAAVATDEEDDSYDLSWFMDLPLDHLAATKRLRALLEEDPDPIDRHFMYCELERRLYRARDVYDSALEQYDEACGRHDGEMDGIRAALFLKFGVVPLLQTYTQMAIRQQKAKDWTRAIWWAERGLVLYGADAARPEAVEDLKKRVVAYRRKLEGQDGVASSRPSKRQPNATSVEVLVCASCGNGFERPRTRGRKPTQCQDCRGDSTA